MAKAESDVTVLRTPSSSTCAPDGRAGRTGDNTAEPGQEPSGRCIQRRPAASVQADCIRRRRAQCSSRACSQAFSLEFRQARSRTASTTSQGAMPGSQSRSVDETKNFEETRQGVPAKSVRRCEARNSEAAESIEARALTAMAVMSGAPARELP